MKKVIVFMSRGSYILVDVRILRKTCYDEWECVHQRVSTVLPQDLWIYLQDFTLEQQEQLRMEIMLESAVAYEFDL